MRGTAALVSAVLVVLAAARPAAADRAAADFFAQRGAKAAKEKKWKEAEESFRKALEQEAVHLPARAGLAEALFGAGNRPSAVEAWRRGGDDAGAVKPLPAGWADALARAKKRLAEVDVAGTTLTQTVDKYVADLVALAERWSGKDPEVVAKALRDAVRLRPGHAKAAAMFAKIGSPAAEFVPLFDGRTLEGWDETEERHWRVVDGQMVGDISTGTYIITHKKVLKGNFDVRVEAKYLERREGLPAFAIGAAVFSNMTGTFLGIAGDEFHLREQDGVEKAAQRNSYAGPIADLSEPFDPEEWTTYEMQFREKTVHVVVNGHELFARDRAAGREEGAISLVIQALKIAVRKVEVMQR